MGPQVDSFEADDRQPARTGIVVIGGGIIGISTALALARAGVAVTLCEKGQLVGEQSSRNWGWVRKTGRDEREIPLIIESLRLWKDMNRTVAAETGFRDCGVLYVSETDADRAHHEAWLERAQPYQMSSRMVEGEELATLMPGAAHPYKAGLYTADDGRAEPQQAGPAIARAAQRAGAVILTQCAVRGLDMAAGRVAGVVTEHGRIACDGVVLAGGAWSRLFCGNMGVDFPQLKVLGSVMRTEPLNGPPDVAVAGPDFAFRKRADGGYTVARRNKYEAHIVPDSFRLLPRFFSTMIATRREYRIRMFGRFREEARIPRRWALDQASPFEATRVLDPAANPAIVEESRRNLVAAFPAFAGARIAESWGGLIDSTPDAVPVIAPVQAVPGFFLMSGFSGHGFGIGPGAGRLMAELITGATPVVDSAPFRFERFGSVVRTA